MIAAMKKYLLISGCIAGAVLMADAAENQAYRQQLEKLKQRPRPVIYNNDGCDAYVFPEKVKFSIEAFLARRFLPLAGTDITTISYNTLSSSFGQFTHPTKFGEFLTGPLGRPNARNAVPDFVALGLDPLAVAIDYAGKNHLELFWSDRVNDCHDVVHRPEKPFPRWSTFKAAHPEYLFDEIGKKMPHGRWSAVDFSYTEVRRKQVEFCTEVAENYRVSGIELDFFRHCYLFRTVGNGASATDAQRGDLTGMMQNIRAGIDRIGERKQQPMLLSIRVPDSVEFCRGVGIDLEHWLRSGLIDILIGSDYFQLNDWSYLVRLGRRYGVKVYASISDTRVVNEHPLLRRGGQMVFRARAAAAWQAGVDGLYIFNEFGFNSPHIGYLKEIGNAAKLAKLNKLYFVTYCNGNPDMYLKDGRKHRTLDVVTPVNLAPLTKRLTGVKIHLGDEIRPQAAYLYCQLKQCRPEQLEVSLNGRPLSYANTSSGVAAWALPSGSWKPGENLLQFRLKDSNHGKNESPALREIAMLFCYDPAAPDVAPLLAVAAGKTLPEVVNEKTSSEVKKEQINHEKQ